MRHGDDEGEGPGCGGRRCDGKGERVVARYVLHCGVQVCIVVCQNALWCARTFCARVALRSASDFASLHSASIDLGAGWPHPPIWGSRKPTNLLNISNIFFHRCDQ